MRARWWSRRSWSAITRSGGATLIPVVIVPGLNEVLYPNLEEKVGVITCVIERVDKDVGLARFALPRLPEEPADVAPRL